MFRFINPKIEIITIKLRDSEILSERLIGENARLCMELEKAQHQSSVLLEKIFELTGINKNKQIYPEINPVANKPFNVGKRGIDWAKTKQTLEQQAQEKYWTDKKNAEEATKLADLENQIGVVSDVSSIS